MLGNAIVVLLWSSTCADQSGNEIDTVKQSRIRHKYVRNIYTHTDAQSALVNSRNYYPSGIMSIIRFKSWWAGHNKVVFSDSVYPKIVSSVVKTNSILVDPYHLRNAVTLNQLIRWLICWTTVNETQVFIIVILKNPLYAYATLNFKFTVRIFSSITNYARYK